MSSVVRTSQTPNFSFHRSSTPRPYSFGKPALNCCGGSLRTLGNMKRPVAASAAADAAAKAPHDRPIQARRVRSGELSSGSRVAVAAPAGAAATREAAAPPGDAAEVVLPARSGTGAAGGRGTTGRAAAAGAAGRGAAAAGAVPGAGAGRAAGVVVWCGVAAGLAPVGGALAVCPATGEPVVAAAPVASPVCGTMRGAGASGLVSSIQNLTKNRPGGASGPGEFFHTIVQVSIRPC